MTREPDTPEAREREQLVLMYRWLVKRCPPSHGRKRPDMAGVRTRWSKAARDQAAGTTTTTES